MAKPGLGSDHQRQRAALPVPYGELCPFHADSKCTGPLLPGQRLQLDHVVARRLGGAGGPVRWAHGSCNERAGGRLGNRIRHGFGKVRSRQW